MRFSPPDIHGSSAASTSNDSSFEGPTGYLLLLAGDENGIFAIVTGRWTLLKNQFSRQLYTHSIHVWYILPTFTIKHQLNVG